MTSTRDMHPRRNEGASASPDTSGHRERLQALIAPYLFNDWGPGGATEIARQVAAALADKVTLNDDLHQIAHATWDDGSDGYPAGWSVCPDTSPDATCKDDEGYVPVFVKEEHACR